MTLHNRQILLAQRPSGWPQESDFQLVETPLPALNDGQVLVHNHYLSLDPYMRGRMNEVRSYAPSMELGQVMIGGTVGTVVESRHPNFAVGDRVLAYLGWQEYGISDGSGLNRISSTRVPLSAYLGAVGIPGLTAWIGLFDIGKPQAGETVVVSAAAGAVGGVVGQLARQRGCRVVGIAGGPSKCQFVVDELGFDACIDYKAGDLSARLREAAPDGIDIYFENVGGEVLDAVVPRLNDFARIPLCGLISQYNTNEPAGFRHLALLLTKRVLLQGFIVSDHMNRWPQALAELEEGVASGVIRYRETIAEGLEQAPRAFIGMLRGENIGKQLVKLSDEG